MLRDHVHSSIHSFIHYEDLYSAFSRLLLRSAPDLCTAKKNSFKVRVEYARMNPGEQSKSQWKPIPHRGPTTENMHWSALWKYEQKGQRVPSLISILSGGSCNLWCPGWDSKDLTCR